MKCLHVARLMVIAAMAIIAALMYEATRRDAE